MASVEYPVAADADDGSFRWSAGVWTKHNDPFVFGHLGVRYFRGFCRFAVEIPVGSTIVSADVYFQAADTTAGATTFQIALIDEDSCPDMSHWDADQGNMTLVAGTVAWSPEDWVQDVYYTTSGIAALVQAFVDRPGYDVGNYIGFRIDEGTGVFRREPYDFAHATGDPAVLRISYSVCMVPLLAERTM